MTSVQQPFHHAPGMAAVWLLFAPVGRALNVSTRNRPIAPQSFPCARWKMLLSYKPSNMPA